MITAMTFFAILLALAATFVALIRYARHDRFAGPASRTCSRDDLGCAARHRLAS